MAASHHYCIQACTLSGQLSRRRLSRPAVVSHRCMRGRVSPVVHAGPAASAPSPRQAKSKLSQLAGRKYGHNLTESQKQDVRGVIKDLEAMQVFLTSTSTSTGVYVNKLQLGPIRADLSATYKFSASDKIDVNFIDIAAYLGSLRLVQKDFGGRSGFWKLTYSDDDLRILYTNQGNVFVLKRANH